MNFDILRVILGRPRPKPRGFGYRTDVQDVDRPFGKLVGGSSTLPAIVRFPVASPVLDQLSTESCVAHAWATLMWYEERHLFGGTPELRSRLFAYFNSRALHGDEHDDGGTYLRTCAKALQKIGCPSEKRWAFTTDQKVVNRQPHVLAYKYAWDFRKLAAYYRIFETGEARVNAVRYALANGHPVAFGSPVDEAFLEPYGEGTIGLPNPSKIAGRHAMTLVGYEPNPQDNGWRFRLQNSWGTDWRNGGFAFMTEEWLKSSDVTDLWVGALSR
jgi:C1A family cysteine protease